MLDQDFTIQSYIQDISPIVEELETGKRIVREFEESLHSLKEEALRYNDNLTIYLCWQDNIGRKLQGRYTDEELLEFHGFARGTIMNFEHHYIIEADEVTQLEFYLCNHQIYTPLGTSSTLNQCLRCN